ncbi:MAG TPA: carboxylesterase/lipase family protein [Edaphobacter sp.]|uniref:carboxylesterase/lipase family protein n=1 Tax=Edaphobacter sp. TaxID=1934404 RepID=UPI002CBFDB9E|nr:carboxylesterase/lipase family protein [Edaphobacter sp.]HUZ95081.1 carboxylesterase/lipase family protein [Edaphobacter sp.]
MDKKQVTRRELLQGSALIVTGSAIAPKAMWGQTSSPVATTTSGKVRGFVQDGVNVFKGIPYGGDTAKRRFTPAEKPAAWTGVREALTFGPQAPQPIHARSGRSAFSPLDEADPVNSEDCLHLNVWTAGLRDGRKRPVMVYIHGGAYSNSSSNGPVYDGIRLAKRGDVVVVTMNHRLNLFGYMYLAKLGGGEFADSGNVGQLDLVLMLEWVRDNIAEFGGDPSRVMIFGQSGGGAKCATLMAMPAAKGLFHRVVTMSGQQLTARTQEHATQSAEAVLAAIGLSRTNLEDIRDPKKVPMERLVAAIRAGKYFGPVLDSRALPRDPFSPDAPAISANVPMILGNTRDETRLLIGSGDPSLFSLRWEELPVRLERYRAFLGDLKLTDIIADYRRWYPGYSASDVFFAVTTAFRSWHGMVIESDRRAAQHGAGFQPGHGPTWAYNFAWKSPVDGGKWGAPHTMDIPFAFDNVEIAAAMTGGGADAQKVADQVSDTFIAFARTGDPNNRAIPKWSRYELTHRSTMIWNTVSRIEDDPRREERKLAEQTLYVQPGT